MKKILTIGTIALSSTLLVACTGNNQTTTNSGTTTETTTSTETTKNTTNSLVFDQTKGVLSSVEVNGQTVEYYAFEGVSYVTNPVEPDYQVMNIYIPKAYFENGSINGYTSETAPIFLPNGVGGYMPAKPKGMEAGKGGAISTNALAITQGYVVASPGARGRTLQTDEKYTGKAPAAIVDLKAAVRYLKFNDKNMAGDSNKIISNGTSAGGALSTLLGATGNEKDYEKYLKEIGAADAKDDIFAVSAYCPITNLENADTAYEWQFDGITAYKKMEITELDYNIQRTLVDKTLTEAEIKASEELKKFFPAYVNSLKLKDENGNLLTLDENGEGTFKEYVKNLVIQSANKAISEGKDLSTYTWLTIENNTVKDIDFATYVASYLSRNKGAPAFDAMDLSAGENNLFGDETTDNRHFTEFGAKNNTATGATTASKEIVDLMNPMNYLKNSSTKNWRIRHGAKDADTSLAISTILATTLKQNNANVDFALPWDQGHGGDYDISELFAWIDSIAK